MEHGCILIFFILWILEFLAVRIWLAVIYMIIMATMRGGGYYSFLLFFSLKWSRRLRLFWYRFVNRFETRKFRYRKGIWDFSYCCFFHILVVEQSERPNRGWTFVTDFKNSSTFMQFQFYSSSVNSNYSIRLLDRIVAKFSKKLLKISFLPSSKSISKYTNIAPVTDYQILLEETISCTHMV